MEGRSIKLLSVAQFADRAGVSRHTIYREVQAGRLPVRRFGSSGLIRIPESALECSIEAPAPPPARPTRLVTGGFLEAYKRKKGLI